MAIWVTLKKDQESEDKENKKEKGKSEKEGEENEDKEDKPTEEKLEKEMDELRKTIMDEDVEEVLKFHIPFILTDTTIFKYWCNNQISLLRQHFH